LENSDIPKFYWQFRSGAAGFASGHFRRRAPFTDAGPLLAGTRGTRRVVLRILSRDTGGEDTEMGRSQKWVASVALVGTVASVVAATMLWFVLTRPEAVAATLGAWLGTGK